MVAKKPHDMNKLRDMVEAGNNKAEIKKAMGVSSGAQVDALMFELCQLDQKVYKPLPGGRVMDEVKVGKKHTMIISPSKLARYDWVKPGDIFKIEKDGQDLVFRYKGQ